MFLARATRDMELSTAGVDGVPAALQAVSQCPPSPCERHLAACTLAPSMAKLSHLFNQPHIGAFSSEKVSCSEACEARADDGDARCVQCVLSLSRGGSVCA